MTHRTTIDLESRLDEVRTAPAGSGRVELIVCRPDVDEREVLSEAVLDPAEGVIGDTWRVRGSSSTANRERNPNRQLTLMSARAATLVAGAVERWPLAGDQLYVDLDLSEAALPPGTQLEVGSAVIEITAEPHLGCAKFAARFGRDALRFVNSPVGRELRLRGVNAKVVTRGEVRPGDVIRTVST